MKSSISYLKPPDCKSFSLDKPNLKRKGKKNKQNNNKNNNIINQDKKITAQQQTFNNLIINQKKKRQIKREKSVDLIQQKSREPSPDFYRETSKITSKRLIANSPFKKSLRKSKNILNKSNESTSSRSFESEDKITPTYIYKHNFENHPKKKIQQNVFEKISTKIQEEKTIKHINNLNINKDREIKRECLLKPLKNTRTIYERKSISNDNNKIENRNEINKKQKMKKKLDISTDINLNKTSDEVLKEYDDKDGNYIVEKGEKLINRYEIIELIGKGSFGIALKCIDHKNKEYVCVKIIKKQEKCNQQAKIEIKLLEYLKKHDPKQLGNFVQLKNTFIFKGHCCLVFELLANNLYEEIKSIKFEGFNLTTIKKFTTQILFSLLCLKHFHIIHCDLKPENILLIEKNLTGLKLIDFGSSCFTSEKIFCYIQSRYYRAPEILLGLEYDIEIDMWSLGCIVFELYTGYPIFPGENEYDTLYYIMEFIGLPPKNMIISSPKKNLFFDKNCNPLERSNSFGKIRKPNTKSISKRLKNADKSFIKFVKECLKWDRKERLCPLRALRHEWIIKDLGTEMLDVHNNKIEEILNNNE